MKGKDNEIYYSAKFHTWTFSSFNGIQEMFYKNGKKIVPNSVEDT